MIHALVTALLLAAASTPKAPAPAKAPAVQTAPAKGAPAAAPAPPAPASKPATGKPAAKPAPTDGLLRTPPQGWSKSGVQQLRWGMGPGDVKDALAGGSGLLQTTEPFELGADFDLAGEGGARVAAPAYQVAGYGSLLGFRFVKGRLSAVAMMPDQDPADPAAWKARLTALLTEKYGPPTLLGERTVWAREGLQVAVPFLPGWTSSVGWFAPPAPTPAEGSAPNPDDPAVKARAEAERAAKEALKAEAQKL